MAVRYARSGAGGAVSGKTALKMRECLAEPPQARAMVHLIVGTVRFGAGKWRYDVLTLPSDVAARLKGVMERHAEAEAELVRKIGKDYPEMRNAKDMESEKHGRYKRLERSLLGETRRERDIIWRDHGAQITHHYFAAAPDAYKKFDILMLGEVRVARIPGLVEYSD